MDLTFSKATGPVWARGSDPHQLAHNAERWADDPTKTCLDLQSNSTSNYAVFRFRLHMRTGSTKTFVYAKKSRETKRQSNTGHTIEQIKKNAHVRTIFHGKGVSWVEQSS